MATIVPRGRTYYFSSLVEIYIALVSKTCLSSLLEWLLVNSNQEHSVWSKAILSGSLNITNQVLAGHEVNVVGCTKCLGHLSLLLTTIDSNDAEAHSLSVLASQ